MKELKSIVENLNLAWLVISENKINHALAKLGGNPPSLHNMSLFQNDMKVCNLIDLGFVGKTLHGK